MKKIVLLLCTIMASFVLVTNANAQPPDPLSTSDLAKLGIPPASDVSTRLSSATDWEQIPRGAKLSYAINNLYGNRADFELTESDLEWLELGSEGTPPNDRYFAALNQTCEIYQSRIDKGLPVGLGFVIRAFENGEQYELEDKYSFYEQIYSQVSMETKKLLLEQVEALRGTNLLSTSKMNWAVVGAKDPDGLRAAFARSCENIDISIKNYEFNRANPGVRNILLPITGGN